MCSHWTPEGFWDAFKDYDGQPIDVREHQVLANLWACVSVSLSLSLSHTHKSLLTKQVFDNVYIFSGWIRVFHSPDRRCGRGVHCPEATRREFVTEYGGLGRNKSKDIQTSATKQDQDCPNGLGLWGHLCPADYWKRGLRYNDWTAYCILPIKH